DNGQWDMAKWLLAHGARVDQGSPVLICAAQNPDDDPTGVDLLLARKAPMDAVNQQQRTALMEAAAQRNLHIVNRFIDAGANIAQADKHGITALMEAARQGATSIVQALIDADVDIHARDAHDRDALMLAAGSSRSSAETIEALV